MKQFLGFLQIIEPEKDPSLKSTWNLKLCSLFFDVMVLIVKETTVVNHHNALKAVRTYLEMIGQCPSNFANLNHHFNLFLQNAIRKKKLYVDNRKALLSNDTGLLWKFYRWVYHNKKFFRDFYKITDRVKDNLENGLLDKLNSQELFFCTALVLCVLTATNFHRSGNFALIECAEAKSEINRALKTLRKKNPDFKQKGRVLDKNNIEPAVLRCDGATKQKGLIWYVVPRPRDIELIGLYIKYVRKFGPKPPSCSKLLINSRGASIGQNVTYYLKRMGDIANVQGLTCLALRSRIETESFQAPEVRATENLSNHLGHTVETAKRYYLNKDKRYFIKASLRSLHLLEEIGEDDNHPVCCSET